MITAHLKDQSKITNPENYQDRQKYRVKGSLKGSTTLLNYSKYSLLLKSLYKGTF